MSRLADGVSLETFKSTEWDAGKLMKLHPSFQKPAIYVRNCYSLLYSDIKDLSSLGFSYLHISGDPGIGKSCFLWYVLVRLLNDAEENGSAIIVELVHHRSRTITRTTMEFAPGGNVSSIESPAASEYCTEPGTWLLTDQACAGSRAAMGTTVLFGENCDQAWKTMDPARFRRLFMPPFSLEELQAVFFSSWKRNPRNLRQFWTRYYLFGPVMRWYNMDMGMAFGELSAALTEMVNEQVYDRIFSHWPTEDFSRCAFITFVSEWAARSFAIRCFKGEVDDCLKNTVILSTDPQLRSGDIQGGGPRKPARCVTRTKQEVQRGQVQQKTKRTAFQMISAIGEEQDSTVNYDTRLTDVYERVRARMVGDEDPDAVCFRDLVPSDTITVEQHIDVIMRRGQGCAQYNEGYEESEFGVWIEADRVLQGSVYTTKVKLECTRGSFRDGVPHELKIFINERVHAEYVLDDFVPLVLSKPETTVVECEFEEDKFSAQLLSSTEALVTITSATRDCKCFCLAVE